MTNEFIGRRLSIWVGKESVAGTKVAASYWIAKETGIITPLTEKMRDTNAIGRIEQIAWSNIVKESSEIEMSGIARDQSLGLLLYSTFWALSTVANADVSWNVYDHTFSVSNTNNHQSLTVWAVDPVNTADSKSEYATFWMINTFEIEAIAGDYVKFNASMMAQKMEDDTNVSPSFLSENVFTNAHATVKFADTEAWLTGAPTIELSRVRLSLEKNALDYQALWTTDLSKVLNQALIVSGDLDIIYNDKTYRDLARTDLKKYMQINIKNTNVTIWTAANPEINIIMNQVALEEWSKTDDVDWITTQTFGFTCEYNKADTEALTFKLTNLVTSY